MLFDPQIDQKKPHKTCWQHQRNKRPRSAARHYNIGVNSKPLTHPNLSDSRKWRLSASDKHMQQVLPITAQMWTWLRQYFQMVPKSWSSLCGPSTALLNMNANAHHPLPLSSSAIAADSGCKCLNSTFVMLAHSTAATARAKHLEHCEARRSQCKPAPFTILSQNPACK